MYLKHMYVSTINILLAGNCHTKAGKELNHMFECINCVKVLHFIVIMIKVELIDDMPFTRVGIIPRKLALVICWG